MSWLTAGMTLVPSAIPTSTRALADEGDEVGVDLVLERHLEAGVAVVAGLVGEVELGELDARDVAQPDRQRRPARRSGSVPWSRRGRRGAASAGGGEQGDGRPARRRGPAGRAALRWRPRGGAEIEAVWLMCVSPGPVRPRGGTARTRAQADTARCLLPSGLSPSAPLARPGGRGRVCASAGGPASALVGSPRCARRYHRSGIAPCPEGAAIVAPPAPVGRGSGQARTGQARTTTRRSTSRTIV